jgi:hypothetical protein
MIKLDKNNKFKKYFNTVLEQAEATDIAPDEVNPETDQAALEQGLDPETDPKEFDVKPVDIGIQSGVVKKITDFIQKIEEFSKFLNSENTESINKYINEIDKEGSILKGISRESSKVTTVAENLASLAEAFRGQLLVAMRKHREKEAASEDF